MMYHRPPICCDACGNGQDFNYIRWEGRALCASCFHDAVEEYADKFPFLLAEEMGLEVLRVPEEEVCD